MGGVQRFTEPLCWILLLLVLPFFPMFSLVREGEEQGRPDQTSGGLLSAPTQ